jgi:uncharacterized protein YaaQ
MKMVLAIVQADDAPKITDALVEAGHRVTRIATTGAWLRRQNATLLLGVEDERVDEVLGVLQQTGQHRTSKVSLPRESQGTLDSEEIKVEVGSATIFVLDVEDSRHY